MTHVDKQRMDKLREYMERATPEQREMAETTREAYAAEGVKGLGPGPEGQGQQYQGRPSPLRDGPVARLVQTMQRLGATIAQGWRCIAPGAWTLKLLEAPAQEVNAWLMEVTNRKHMDDAARKRMAGRRPWVWPQGDDRW